jgi:hypothetical protein
MVYSGAWGKLTHEKNQKSKISWHCPFNYTQPASDPIVRTMLSRQEPIEIKN